MNKDVSETITIRISKRILDNLREHAKNENTTLNSFINNCLSFTVEWDIVAAEAQWIPVPKKSLITILEQLDEETIESIASNLGHAITKENLLIMRGRYNIANLISILKYQSKAAGFGYTELYDDSNEIITIKHDMGIKWSIWYKEFYSSIFEDLNVSVQLSITENIIQYKIPKSKILETSSFV